MGSLRLLTEPRRYRRQIIFVKDASNRMQAKVIRKPLASESYETTLPGFSKVLNKNASFTSRVVWLFISLGIFGVCFYQIAERITLYAEDLSSVRQYYITKKTSEFPSVTLCPLENVIKKRLNFFKNSLNSSSNYDTVLKNKTFNVYDIWNSALLSFENVYVNLNQIPGSDDLFDQSKVYTQLGLCLTISPNEKLEFYISELTLAIRIPRFRKQSAFRLIVHKKEDVFNKKFFLPEKIIAFNTRLLPTCIVHFAQHVRRNRKNSACTESTHVTKCSRICKEGYISSNIDKPCRLPFMQWEKEVPFCNSAYEAIDVLAKVVKISRNFDPIICKCPQKCREVVYTPPDCHAVIESAKLNVKIIENKIPVMDEQRKYRWCSLCCELGGLIGLWLGICIMQLLTMIKNSVLRHFITISLYARFTACESAKRYVNNYVRRTQYVSLLKKKIFNLFSPRIARTEYCCQHQVIWPLISAVVACFGMYICVLQVLFYFSQPLATSSRIMFIMRAPVPLITVCLEPKLNNLLSWEPSLLISKYGHWQDFPGIMNLSKNGNITLTELWNMTRIPMWGKPYSMHNDEIFVNVSYTAVGTCSTIFLEKFQRLTSVSFKWINKHVNYLRVIFHESNDFALLPFLPKLSGYKMPTKSMTLFKIRFVEINRETCRHGNITAQCLVTCIETEIVKNSAKPCSLPYMKNYDGLPACSSVEDLIRITNTTLSILKRINLENCKCPKKCKEIVYSVTKIKQIAKSTGDSTIILKHADETYQVLEEYCRYKAADLFSDIGSILGLFLGTCGLSAADCVIGSLFKVFLAYKVRFLSQHKTNFKTKRFRSLVVSDKSKEIRKKEECEITVPGFVNVLKQDSPLWVRVFWLLLSLSALFGCVYQCIENIKYFWSDPSEVHIRYIINNTIAYPMVIICPQFSLLDYVVNTKKDILLERILEKLWLNNTLNVSQVEVYFNSVKLKNVLISQADTFYGRCVVIRPTKELLYSGKHAPLRIKVKISSSRFFDVCALQATDDFFRISYERRPYLHSVTDKHHSMNISLSVREDILRNTARYPCVDGELVSKCEVNCLENRIYGNASKLCRLPFMQYSEFIPICKSLEERKSMYLLAKLYNTNFQMHLDENCSCPRKCRQLWYSFNIISLGKSKDNKSTGASEINVVIPDNNIFVTQEEPAYTLFKLLPDIGGVLGLYFGFGFLQITELVEIFFVKLIALTCKTY